MTFEILVKYTLWVYLAMDLIIILSAAAIGQWGYFIVFLGYGITTLGLIVEAWKWL